MSCLHVVVKALHFIETEFSYQYRNIKPFIKEQTKNEQRSPVERALLCSLPPESEMNT